MAKAYIFILLLMSFPQLMEEALSYTACAYSGEQPLATKNGLENNNCFQKIK